MNQERTLPKARRMLPALATAAVLAASATALPAASGYWTSTSDSDWANAGNWSVSPAPGSTAGLSTDTATFRGGDKQLVVSPDANRSIGYLFFSQVSVGDAGNFVIGSATGNALHLGRTDGAGNIDVQSNLTTPNVTETLNAPLILYGPYQFINSSPASSTVLVINGPITSGASGANDVQLKGVNTGTNVLRGTVSDGVAAVGLTKLNAGTWWVFSTNAFTRMTRVSQGTLVAGVDSPSGGPGAFGSYVSTQYHAVGLANGSGDAAMLAAEGVTIGIRIETPATTAGSQTSTLGGANTAGTSYFTGVISTRRNPTILQCATGGTVAFSPGTWADRGSALVVGSSGARGTVRFANNAIAVPNPNGVSVAYGTLEVAGRLAGGVSVADGAALTGSGAIVSNGVATAVTVAGGGTLDPGSIGGLGTLSVTGNVTFASGGRFAVQAQGSGADLLKVAGTVTATDPVIVATAPDDAFGPWLVMSASSIDPAFEEVSLPSGLVLSLKQGGTALWLSRTRGTLLMLH